MWSITSFNITDRAHFCLLAVACFFKLEVDVHRFLVPVSAIGRARQSRGMGAGE